MNLKEYKKIIKNKNNQLFLLILIISAVLIFASGINSENKAIPTISEEQRLEEILSDISGAGNVSVMITYYESSKSVSNEKNKAKGAVITASGCDNPAVKAALSDAACAALDLPAHKVCVYLKKSNRKD